MPGCSDVKVLSCENMQQGFPFLFMCTSCGKNIPNELEGLYGDY